MTTGGNWFETIDILNLLSRLITIMALLAWVIISHLDFKGIWIPRWSLDERQKIFTVLDGRFNHIFLQVFANGEAYYPSAIAPSRKNSDQWLVDFLAEAHRRDIKVSAWINVCYFWGYAPWINDAKHPIASHHDWFVVDSRNRSILYNTVDELKEKGIEGYYISPAHPHARAYVVSVILEILGRYDFDGIHFDYIRYPNTSYVFDAALRTKFERQYCIDPLALISDDSLPVRFSLWGYDNLAAMWNRFIGEDLTGFIKELRSAIKDIRGNIYVSAAVKPDYRLASVDYHQDWLTWLNSNYLDFVCLMAYSSNIENYLSKLDNIINEPQRVMVGLGLYNQTLETIDQQVNYVKRSVFGGVVFFSYEEAKKNREYLKTIKKQLLP